MCFSDSCSKVTDDSSVRKRGTCLQPAPGWAAFSPRVQHSLWTGARHWHKVAAKLSKTWQAVSCHRTCSRGRAAGDRWPGRFRRNAAVTICDILPVDVCVMKVVLILPFEVVHMVCACDREQEALRLDGRKTKEGNKKETLAGKCQPSGTTAAQHPAQTCAVTSMSLCLPGLW